MYHGESAKNVEALFRAAREQDAVLFLDEADSILSRRLVAPSQGSEHAVNAMRSELLLSLDRHEGIVIFATNLVEAYDPAFESRVTHVEFCLPDEAARKAIWRLHLPAELPLDDDVSVDELAVLPGLSGRDIKRAVVTACLAVARAGRTRVAQKDFVDATETVMPLRHEVQTASVGGLAALSDVAAAAPHADGAQPEYI
jgi:ATP-dependent 26S proteasome regulatory subunit